MTDGPGCRMTVFFQGCALRCKYCHNPDSWDLHGGTEMTAEEILAEFSSTKEFYKNGGVTFSGGEPLLQFDFLLECLKLFRANNIHTALDTSGYIPDTGITAERVLELLHFCDLVILDIKAFSPELHKELTGVSNERILEFATAVKASNTPLWVRRVIVPGVTDSYDDLSQTGAFLRGFPNLTAIDTLPYHTLGLFKYEKLGLEYPLHGVREAMNTEALAAREVMVEALLAAKQL
jgi:pyruvate formate lyase activating enzyme